MFKRELLVITGAGQGIGKNIALSIPKKYDLILISKSNKCKKVALSIKKLNKSYGRRINYLKINFEKKISTKQILKNIDLKKYIKIHLILCAGVLDSNQKSYLDEKQWNKLFNVNFLSNVKIINIFLRFYKKSKKQNKIIIFSGGGAASSFKEFPIYSATKTAIVRTVENYSEIFSKTNLSIFAIAPGAVNTNMLKKVIRVAKVGTKSKMNEVTRFINQCLKINTSSFNGKLIHIKDNFLKIKKNKNKNYLKLRRFE